MAYGILAKPGTKAGPCRARCRHVDCGQTRADAAAACRFCTKPIGYGVAFNRAPHDGSLAHRACLDTAAEANDARVGLFA